MLIRVRLSLYIAILSCAFCVCVSGFCAVSPGDGLSVSPYSSDSPYYRDSLYRLISVDGSVSISCRFTYLQGSSSVDPSLGDNAVELSSLDAFIRCALSHPGFSVRRVRLTGYSSVEGSYTSNDELSRDRVRGFYRYLRLHYPGLYRYPHDVAWVAEDWVLLSDLIGLSDLSERDEMLDIIRNVRSYDEREALLSRLNGGHAYRELLHRFFPRLRRVELQIDYQPVSFSAQPSSSTADPLIYSVLDRDTVDFRSNRSLAQAFERTSPGGWEYMIRRVPPGASFRFALKTNLLQWAGIRSDFCRTTAVLNASLEYFITGCWSLEAGASYSYWRYRTNLRFQGLSGYRLEPRYYSRLSGLSDIYIGLYGRVGDYDLRKRDDNSSNNNTNTSSTNSVNSTTAAGSNSTTGDRNHTGDYWDAGFSAGMHVRLSGNLGFEAGFRWGYLRSKPVQYTIDGPYNWYESESRYSRFRVTDLNISLVYRFR